MGAGDRVVASVGEAKQGQFGVINLLKAVAAQLIVLHHLAFYGRMADHARPLMPDLIDWLADDARIAVQVFLVIGGFLVAKSLGPRGTSHAKQPARRNLATLYQTGTAFRGRAIALCRRLCAGMGMDDARLHFGTAHPYCSWSRISFCCTAS